MSDQTGCAVSTVGEPSKPTTNVLYPTREQRAAAVRAIRPMRVDAEVGRRAIERAPDEGVLLNAYVCDCGKHSDLWRSRCANCGSETRYVSYVAWPLAVLAASDAD